jgi:ABC-type glucose/galactose transport system permease subunit
MNLINKFMNNQDLKTKAIDNAMYLILLTILIVVSFLRPIFLSGNNLTNILMNASIRIIIALGVSGALIGLRNETTIRIVNRIKYIALSIAFVFKS